MTFPSYHDPDFLYFVTASIIGWKPLFNEKKFINVVLNSLSWMRVNNRIYLFGFVIMPHHLHMIIKPKKIVIGDVLQQFGSFTAHKIIKMLENKSKYGLLAFFHANRRPSSDRYSVWQDIQAQAVTNNRVLWEKMEYIHNNPISKRYHLAGNRADYPFSSACYYDLGQDPIIEIDDLRDWLESQ